MKKHMFKKLRNKFLLLNMVIISVVMLASFSVIYTITYARVQSENYSMLNSTASVTGSGPLFLIEPEETEDGGMIGRTKNVLFFNITLDDTGDICDVQSPFAFRGDLYLEAREAFVTSNPKIPGTFTLSFAGMEWLCKSSLVVGRVEILDFGVLRPIAYTKIAFVDITASRQNLVHLTFTFLVSGSVMLFVIFGISLFFANRAVAPVERAWNRQQQFLADASHELKTPLSVISANTDALLANRTETVESQEKWISYISAETDRMSKLVCDLLFLARSDGSQVKSEILPFDLSAEVSDVILSMEAVAFEKGIVISQNIPAGFSALGNDANARKVVSILMDNAIKYTPPNGSIYVRLYEVKHHVIFSIENTCDGIPKENLKNIFNRFYRAEQSRVHDGSFGLGLSIAKAAVEDMDGKITVKNDNKSVTFTFVLRSCKGR